jgi:hypothetical protein
VRDAARSLGLQLHVLDASTEREIDAAFGKLIELRAGALVVSVDLFLNNQRAQIVALAARHAVPAIYGVREFATAGGLMSYGNDLARLPLTVATDIGVVAHLHLGARRLERQLLSRIG